MGTPESATGSYLVGFVIPGRPRSLVIFVIAVIDLDFFEFVEVAASAPLDWAFQVLGDEVTIQRKRGTALVASEQFQRSSPCLGSLRLLSPTARSAAVSTSLVARAIRCLASDTATVVMVVRTPRSSGGSREGDLGDFTTSV